MLLGVDVGGTFTDAVLAVDGRLITAKAPTTPEDQSEGVLAAVRAVLERAGADAERGGGVRPRDDRRHQRAARGPRRADGAHRHRGLHRHRRARPPGPPRALPAVRGAPGAADRARGPLRRPRADDPRRPAARARRRRAPAQLARAGGRRRGRGRWRSPAALLPPPRARAGDRPGAGARRCPDVHVSLSHEVVGTFREFERAGTTEVDAALSPLLGGYLRRLVERCDEAGLPEPAIMQSSGGLIDLDAAAEPRRLDGAVGPGGRRGRRGLHRPGRRRARRACASTWAAPPATCASSTTAPCRRRARERSPAGRWRCRWSPSTPSAPAAARSPGATRAARCGWARARRAPTPGRRATAAAAPSRPSPTPTSCSATWPATRRWPAASSSTARPRERAVGELAGELGLEPRPAPRGSSASPTPRWSARCGW